MLQYLILFGTVDQFRHKRYSNILKQNGVLFLKAYHSFCYLEELLKLEGNIFHQVVKQPLFCQPKCII